MPDVFLIIIPIVAAVALSYVIQARSPSNYSVANYTDCAGKIDVLTRKISELESNVQSELITRNTLVAQLRSEIEYRAKLEARIRELERILAVNRISIDGEHDEDNNAPSKKQASRISVLGIWPTVEGSESLDFQSEIDAIFNAGFDYTKLIGNVGRSKIMDELGRKSYQIIQVGSHAYEDRIMLSDDAPRPGWWARIAQRYGAEIVMLMACDTLKVADSMHSAGVGTTIAIRGKIPDKQVVLFIESFYRLLGARRSALEAFEIAQLSMQNGYADMVVIRQNQE